MFYIFLRIYSFQFRHISKRYRIENETLENKVNGCHFKFLLNVFQIMYFSSLFPYVVLLCFLIRGLLLNGSLDGIRHMFTPKVCS